MRTAFPLAQADDGWSTPTLSDSALLESDAANTKGYKGPFLVYFGGSAAANIAVKTAQGTNLVFKNVQPGSILPVGILQLRSTSTTAAAADMVVVVGRQGFI
jgi:hypothetical protein